MLYCVIFHKVTLATESLKVWHSITIHYIPNKWKHHHLFDSALREKKPLMPVVITLVIGNSGKCSYLAVWHFLDGLGAMIIAMQAWMVNWLVDWWLKDNNEQHSKVMKQIKGFMYDKEHERGLNFGYPFLSISVFFTLSLHILSLQFVPHLVPNTHLQTRSHTASRSHLDSGNALQ